MPLFCMKMTFGKNFQFHSILDYKLKNKFLSSKFGKKILSYWMIYYNKYVQINKKTTYFKRFSEHNVIFVMDLVYNSGKVKSWHVL